MRLGGQKRMAYGVSSFFRLSRLSSKLNIKLISSITRIMGKSLMPHGEFVIACIFLSEAAQGQAA